MKKLNKLQINNEKIIKDDELLNLRGGNGMCPDGSFECYCNGVLYGCNIQVDRCLYACGVY